MPFFVRFALGANIILMSFVSLQQAGAEACPKNQTWVSAHKRQAYTKSDGTFVSASSVVGHCRTRSRAYDFWIERFSNGSIVGWPHKKEKFKTWNRGDIEAVVYAMDRVPAWVWEKVAIHRADRSATSGNVATSSDAVIVLYDNAFFKGAPLERYLAHELAHEKYRKMSAIDSMDFKQTAEWREQTDRNSQKSRLVLTRSRKVENDSDLSPEEDFANNLEYFLYDSEKLKFQSPVLYDWFNIQFGETMKAEEAGK